MAVLKCKMCGGDLNIGAGESVGVCEFCGTKQTLPKLDNDRKNNLYDRANHFRRNNEYDKAMAIFENILNEDNTDAESYWSLVLCKYGIEYVKDPVSGKRVPTVNRAQFTSVFADENYKSAIKYANLNQRSIYEEEAKAIDEIQKGILAISQKEKPFDVFICYKETDASGSRTKDSVIANELYHELTKEGFKVFFSRITLEDKLGTAYEPYIFAALNSSKVMVVIGTKSEYLNAVWVKNEWSRYLALIRNGEKKMLIPAYRDMDPYDLPEEFSHLQAQDMSKLGFMQDLIRGIKKIAQADTPKTTVVKETVISSGNANTAPLLKRAFMFLEDGDWNSANEYCEKVLDIDPENAQAYLGKLLSELRVRKQEFLKDQAEPFDHNNNYQKAVRFADDKLKTELASYIEYINTRNENARLEGIYTRAKNATSAANTESAYKEAAHLFESIDEYQDSAVLAQSCYEKAEVARKDAILSEGKAKMTGESISNYESAIKMFKSISGWKDADEQIIACQRKIEEIKAKEEAERLEKERKAEIARKEAERTAKRNKKIAIITTPIVCAVIAFIVVLNTVIIPNGKYNDAIALMDAGNIVEAYEALVALGGYKDSADKANSIYDKYKVEKLKVAKAGDYVFFGSYEQDNNTANSSEEIEWLVLEHVENRLVLISKYIIDATYYHGSVVNTTWAESDMRAYLNNEFYKTAFDETQRQMILKSTITTQDSTEGVDGGPDTEDKVYLLSIEEVERYFTSYEERKVAYTPFVVAKEPSLGAFGYNTCGWFLRSPGISKENRTDYASGVNGDGYVSELQTDCQDIYGVRPVICIDTQVGI